MPARLLAEGAERVVAHCTLHSIPWRLLEADPRDVPAWTHAALQAIDSLLEVASSASPHT